MNATTASSHEQQAVNFTEAVREHLADLPENELDELLDGLQADLVERLDEGDELGDSQQYADELRQAAGLPQQGDSTTGQKKPIKHLGGRLRERNRELGRRTRAFWQATPARRAILEFLVSLRPIWWVVRGLVITWLLLVFIGYPMMRVSLPAVLLAAGFVVISVQWGRGLWAQKAWLVGSRRAASVIAGTLLLPVAALGWNAFSTPDYIETEPSISPGLSANGQPISNIFAFDCSGKPVDGVQLFDQEGEPITTLEGDAGPGEEAMHGFDDRTQQNISYERNGFVGYAGLWNVFPLQEARTNINLDPAHTKATDARWPIQNVEALSPECPTIEPDAQVEVGTP